MKIKTQKFVILCFSLFLICVGAVSTHAFAETETEGAAFSGWVFADGQKYYYEDGVALTGWKYVEGPNGEAAAWRYFDDETGATPVCWTYITRNDVASLYYFWSKGDGTYAKGLVQNISLASGEGIGTYFFGSDGKMKTGWNYVNGSWRYFDDETGIAPAGWRDIERSTINTYYFWSKADGSCAKGIVSSIVGRDGLVGEYYFNSKSGVLVRNADNVKDGYWTISTDADGKVTYKLYAPATLKGIDVSEFQENVDWAAVKASGVQFVIIRAGWTSWPGATYAERGNYFKYDSKFVEYVRAAKAQGLQVGAYIYVYSHGKTEQRAALEEFHAFAQSCGLSGSSFELPVFLDIEDSKYYLPGTNDRGGNGYRTEMLREGLQQLRSYGYRAGFYASLYWSNTYFDTYTLKNEGYSFWLASYYNNNQEFGPYDKQAWNGAYPSIWQYRSTGSVSGISGNVDMDHLYTSMMGN